MSVHFWGEKARGTWVLELINDKNDAVIDGKTIKLKYVDLLVN